MLEKCESFFSSKLASFLSEPKSEKEDDMRAIARANVMESQSIIYKEKSFGDFVENTLRKSEGLIQSTPTPPTRLLVGSALVPAAGGQMKNGQLAGTFSAPVGRGGSFQGPFTGALHGSLRVPSHPSHGSFVASPTQAVRELDDAQKEDMRKQFSDSVKQLMNGQGQAQVNFVQRAHSAMAPSADKPTALMESSRLKMHLGNNNSMMVPVLRMQQGFGVTTSRQTTAGDAPQRGRSPLALANIAEGRAMSLSSKMPLMTNRGESGVTRQSSKQ